jgi:hypothetical protein
VELVDIAVSEEQGLELDAQLLGRFGIVQNGTAGGEDLLGTV